MLSIKGLPARDTVKPGEWFLFFDRQLWPFTEGVRLRIAWAVAIGIVAAALGIARLGLIGWLLGLVFTGARFDDLIAPFALVAVVMVARGGVEYYRTMIAHRTASTVQQSLRQKLYDQVVRLGPAHFGHQRTGDVILTVVEGVEQLETYFGQYLPQFFVAAVTPILVFAFVAFLDLTIAIVLLVAVLVTLFAPIAWHSLDNEKSRIRSREYGAFAADFLDAIQGLTTLKAFGQSRARTKILEARADALFKSTMWVLATNTLSRGITDTGIAVGAAVSLGWGAYRVADGEMSLTVLLVILMLGVEVFRPLRDLRILLHQGMIGRSAATGILTFLNTPPLIEAPSEPASGHDALDSSVTFADVTFTYPGSRQPAHNELSFTVGAGERVAIVGPSGVGKSTIVTLLLRFFDPDRGQIRVGGADIRTLTFAELRHRIAVVRQDAFLFHGTVEDNLRMGKPDATPDELDAAVRAANAQDFIARLPQGYETVVGERGVRLSAGQRQRIAIARSLLRDAPILVLDEALSSVDAENESVIQEALERLMVGRTTLIFAHRLSSVIDADRILVLDGGHLAETGTHAELIGRPGPYHALMAPQLRDQDANIVIGDGDTIAQDAEPQADIPAGSENFFEQPTDAIIRAEGMSWPRVTGVLLGLIAPWRRQLIATFMLGVLRVCSLIGVGVFSALIVLALKSGEAFGAYLIWLGVVAILSGLLHWWESWLAHDMAYRLLGEMRIAIFRKLDELAPAYFTRRRTGDLVGVATHDVEMVEYFFAHTIAPAFVAVVVPAVVVGTLVLYGWQMALALAPFLAIAGLQPLLLRTRIDRLGSRARETLGDLNAHALDTVQGLGEVVAFEQERERGREFADKTARYVEMRLPFFRDLTIQTVLQEVAAGLGGLAVVVAGAGLVATGELTSGILPLLTILAMSAFLPISEIAQVGRQLADTLGATRRVYAIHDEEVPVRSGAGVSAGEDDAAPALAFENVTFSYPGRITPALDSVSLEVPSGSTLALVGPSGAGKTTVANLILRFWDPQDGTIKLKGHDIRDYDLDDLRHHYALVAQDTHLFNESLRNNIAIAKPDADDAEIAAAVDKTALTNFVESLPEGLDTMVGERGAQLSGGQRQRVTIARAFLKGAPILILDEATSHLDAVNEAAVHTALERLMQDRTTIVIAHRLSTVRNADMIAVLDGGRVAETGTHHELLARNGIYAHLVARQLGAAAAE